MTIRERSELSLFNYLFKLVIPRGISLFAETTKDAVPFFYNLFFLILSPILFPISAYISRKKDREFVKNQDLKNRTKNENI